MANADDGQIMRGMGRRIRDAREAARLNQEDVARSMGVSRATVPMWETGETTISGPKLQRLAKLLERPAGWFYGDIPPRKLLDQFDTRDLLNYLAGRAGSRSDKEQSSFSRASGQSGKGARVAVAVGAA